MEIILTFRDGSSKASVKIAYGILEQLKYVPAGEPVFEQTVGDLFEAATKEFFESICSIAACTPWKLDFLNRTNRHFQIRPV